MNTKWIVAILGVIGVFVIGSSMVASSPRNQNTSGTSQLAAASQSSSKNQNTASSGGAPATSYTLPEVATHNSASSCWTTINGKVYDVTTWIQQHPGGQGPILSLCGIDGSAAFNGKHGGQRRPASELASFVIGDLTQ